LDLPVCASLHASQYHPLWSNDRNNIFEEYKLWSCSLCNFLQSPVTSSLLGPNIFLSTYFSHTQYWFLLMLQTKFHTHITQHEQL
jgi:hypothetical protein